MVHSAYDVAELLHGCPSRPGCASAYGDRLLLGCADGALRVYAPQSSGEDSSPPPPQLNGTEEIRRAQYVIERTLTSFWRRAPLAMEASPSRGLLLSLSEWIALHRLPNLETVAAVSKTKGANVYSWDDRRGMLCVGRHKRVGIYRLDGGRELIEVKEFGVPDTVKSMAWCGENICLGIKREYVIMNSTTGALSEVFPSGRIAPPLAVPLPSGELLLGKDNIGVFVDQNGKLMQDGRICWSEAPASVVIHRPYALARLARHIEIRSLRAPYQLVQTVVLRDAHLLLQSSNCALVIASNSVYALLPVPIGAQIVQLTASGDFEEALALCKLLPPEDSSLRAAKEASIHIRYGHYLFDSGSYEEAMEQFLASQVDITYVLSLYPSIILPKTLHKSEHEISPDATEALHLSRVSSDVSDETETFLPSHIQESDDNTTVEAKKISYNAIMALAKYLQKKRFVIIEKATAEITEEVVSDAVHESMVSVDSYRPKSLGKKRGNSPIRSIARETATVLDTALVQALVLTGQSSAALELLKGPNYCDLKICEEFFRERKSYIALLELYKSNEMHREALKLMTQLVQESSSGNENSELLSQKFKPNMIIDYLKPLCRTDPMLVLEFSTYVLQSCPTETIELFLHGNVPADMVNSYLKQHAPNMQSTYLELMLSMSENGINTSLQNELVQIYLSEVLDWYKELKQQNTWDEKNFSPTRKKLLSALEGITGYNAQSLLKHFPSDALFEERAMLLGKMNQHQLALSLYVHKLQSPDLAVAYCDRVHESADQPLKSNANIYLMLLQIYLNPRKTTKQFEQMIMNSVPYQNTSNQKAASGKLKGSRMSKKIAAIEGAADIHISPGGTDSGRSDVEGDEMNEEGGPIMLNDALDLLSKRWDRINGAQALRLLPRDTKLQNLLPFLEPLLKKSSEGSRNYSVIKSLRVSENLQVKEDLYKHQRKLVKIDGDSTCSLCHKRIGSSVFAVYPNGKTLVHFLCFRDSQNIKALRSAPSKRTQSVQI